MFKEEGLLAFSEFSFTLMLVIDKLVGCATEVPILEATWILQQKTKDCKQFAILEKNIVHSISSNKSDPT